MGEILFLTRTRFDLLYATSYQATKGSNPTMRDFKGLLHIVGYLKNTTDWGILFKRNRSATSGSITSPRLMCYADASYANHVDSKSHTGYILKLADDDSAPFVAISSKQKITALSSCQAEIEALIELTKEVIYWRVLLEEIGLGSEEPTTIKEDNKSAITLSKSFGGKSKRVKHFLLRINFLNEQVQNKIIDVEYCPTKEMIADVLTKHMGSNGVYLFCKILGRTDTTSDDQW